MNSTQKTLVSLLASMTLGLSGCVSKECPLISGFGPNAHQKAYLNSWHDKYGSEITLQEVKELTNNCFTKKQAKQINKYAKKYLESKNQTSFSDCELLAFEEITKKVRKYYK